MNSIPKQRRRATQLMLSLGLAGLLAVPAFDAAAQTRVTYKSAKSGTSYYQMAVEIAQAMKAGTDGKIIVTVEESQGSVQNVLESASRSGNYVFTTPPSLVKAAHEASGPFKDKANPKFAEIRGLFPIPSLTMHFVMRDSADVKSITDLEGKTLLLGKGSFGANEGAKYLKLFGLDGKVKLAEVELSNAVPALKNGQIDGFVTAGSYPAPNVIEAAAGSSVTLLSFSDEQVKLTGATRFVIPAGTYAGQKADVVTTSLPVIAYTTTQMDDDTAYQLTRTYWTQRDKMAASAPWWNGVDKAMLASIEGKIHPGALRFYKEAGYPVSDAQR